MFTVKVLHFKRFETEAHADVGGFEGCLSGSPRERCVFGTDTRAQTEGVRGVHYAHGLKRGRATGRHQCLLTPLWMRCSHSPRFWALDVDSQPDPGLRRLHLHLNDWSPVPADNRL